VVPEALLLSAAIARGNLRLEASFLASSN
jgi:hypothetical protein